MAKTLRSIGSLAFVVGLFVTIFAGIPWSIITYDDPVIPWWLRTAIFCLLGGILVVLITLAAEQRGKKEQATVRPLTETESRILLLNSTDVPGRAVTEILGVVQGHTVFAIWIGNDLSALMRLILGGELIEYTDMMGKARELANNRMIAQAAQINADAIINIRYMTTGVVGTASELLAYGTAVKLKKPVKKRPAKRTSSPARGARK